MIHSEVMRMDARTRIQVIRLMELLRKDPGYAKTLGIEAAMKRRLQI